MLFLLKSIAKQISVIGKKYEWVFGLKLLTISYIERFNYRIQLQNTLHFALEYKKGKFENFPFYRVGSAG